MSIPCHKIFEKIFIKEDFRGKKEKKAAVLEAEAGRKRSEKNPPDPGLLLIDELSGLSARKG